MKSIPKRLPLPSLEADQQAVEIHLTQRELSERWRIHQGTLRNWRNQRKGPPYVKLPGGHCIYPLSGVLAYERENFITVNRRTRRPNDPGATRPQHQQDETQTKTDT